MLNFRPLGRTLLLGTLCTASFGCTESFARLLGHDDAVDLLQTTLYKEGSVDKKLTDLAESVVNVEAVSPASSK